MNKQEHKIKNIAILGSTGSIGVQSLEVVRAFPHLFRVEALTSNNNYELLIKQAIEFKPDTVVIGNEKHYSLVRSALEKHNIKVFTGQQSIEQIVEMEMIDLVLIALVGFSGLKPAINAINAKKQIALANKEVLVVAGELITKLAQTNNINIYPIDSEHSAIFQCLAGEFHNPVEKIYLTASGGPFRGMKRESLLKVTKKEALAHPNWSMGNKITIDCATLMNKGLEVIEAKWLFGLKSSQIDVIIHPQSIIHSIVQFCDGSMKAQMGLPDMKLPILYALSYPYRQASPFKRFNFIEYTQFTFEQPDWKSFPSLKLAFHALEKGGNIPCALNAANEIAVDAFLNDKIPFIKIPDIIENCIKTTKLIANPSYDDYIETDKNTRVKAQSLI